MTESSPFITHPIHRRSTLHEMPRGRESTAYRFMRHGNEYIYKIINMERPGSFVHAPIEGTAVEQAAQMNKMYGILKRYYGDEIVNTLFFVAQETKSGAPKVACIQPFIKGTLGSELWTLRKVNGLDEKLNDWEKRWGEVLADPEFQELSSSTRDRYMMTDFHTFNCFRLGNGRYVFFDW